MIIEGYEADLIQGRYYARWKSGIEQEPFEVPAFTARFSLLLLIGVTYVLGVFYGSMALVRLGPMGTSIARIVLLSPMYLPLFALLIYMVVARRRVTGSPSPTPVYPLQIDVNVKEAKLSIGSDEGTLELKDGWLCFEGVKTRFKLRYADLQHSKPIRYLKTETPWLLLPKVKGFSQTYFILSIKSSGATLETRSSTPILGPMIAEWQEAKASAGTPIFPPLECRREKIAYLPLLMKWGVPLALATIMLCLGLAAIFQLEHLGSPLKGCIAVAGMMALICSSLMLAIWGENVNMGRNRKRYSKALEPH